MRPGGEIDQRVLRYESPDAAAAVFDAVQADYEMCERWRYTDPQDRLIQVNTQAVEIAPTSEVDQRLSFNIYLQFGGVSAINNFLLVRDGAIQGEEAYLVVRYEYTPGFDEIEDLSVGAQAHYWFGERVKLALLPELPLGAASSTFRQWCFTTSRTDRPTSAVISDRTSHRFPSESCVAVKSKTAVVAVLASSWLVAAVPPFHALQDRA